MSRLWMRYGDYRARKNPIQRPGSLYEDVQSELRNKVPIASRRWRRQQDLSYLLPLIAESKQAANEAEITASLSGARAWAWLMTLTLQAPQAASAQRQMDAHPHGYKAKNERLYELIDFNDAFVSAVLALPETELSSFAHEAERLLQWFCKRVGVRSFSTEQYHAIVQGLSREIAVYKGVQVEGLQAAMTSRTSDALGIDMVISNPETGKSVNIDCKAPSSYRHRVYTLLHEGRLSEEEVDAAEQLGYIAELNGHGNQKAEIVVWRISTEEYGPIHNFQFDSTRQLGAKIHAILNTYGEGI